MQFENKSSVGVDEELYSHMRDLQRDLSSREEAFIKLAGKVAKLQDLQGVLSLISQWIDILGEEQKMAIARILKLALDVVAENDQTPSKSVELGVCEFCIKWATEENKNFLRFKMEVRLANIMYLRGDYKGTQLKVADILQEAKQVDDKLLLVEAHLLEAKLIYQTRNYPKAKAALTAAKAASNSVYIQPLFQADIDLTAGMIQMAEKDYPIAYSYFYEAFEAFHTNKQGERAAHTFQYLLLAKIMLNALEDASNLLTGRYGLAYGESNPQTALMRRVLDASKQKSVVELSRLFKQNEAELKADRIISSQMDLLFDQLLEQNIAKVLQPYSRIQLDYLSAKLGLEEREVEAKVSQMILDDALKATLDQEKNELILFEPAEDNEMLLTSLEILKNMDTVIDALFERAALLTAP